MVTLTIIAVLEYSSKTMTKSRRTYLKLYLHLNELLVENKICSLSFFLVFAQKSQEYVWPESEEEEESQHRPGPGKQRSFG